MKNVKGLYTAPAGHWVGDGFPVRSMFTYGDHGRALSPFLMLDYAGPARFEPAEKPRGVGQHPHRGFETVTIVYQGEVDHRDSSGGGGHIGPGDVQWMTAAAGIIHEEFHSPEFTHEGGMLEMVQLWVNLPAKDKMSAPRYQTLLSERIPSVTLPAGAGELRVIAGDYQGIEGAAQTFTPMNVWDLKLQPGIPVALPVPAGHAAGLVVLHGEVRVNDSERAGEAELVILDQGGEGVEVQAESEATVLLLSGEPIDEPVAGYGPFVMNTREEIAQAINDFNSGQFGNI